MYGTPGNRTFEARLVEALREGVPFPSTETEFHGPSEGWPASTVGDPEPPKAFNLRRRRRPKKGKPAISPYNPN